MRFDIRRKEFPYSSAPLLDGIAAGYEALAIMYTGDIAVVSRHGNAMEAAIAAAAEAHRLNNSGTMGTRAAVRGFWVGVRPSGVMKQAMPVSYRARA